MSEVRPRRVRVHMYQVGFGDSFLLSFEYGRDVGRRQERHVLIDCGSNSMTDGVTMKAVVERIREDCGGKLDAVVATHRHRDHISAFGAKETAYLFDAMSPDLVVRPWTEDPQRPSGARDFLDTLDRAEALAESVATRIGKERRGVVGELRNFAQAQVKNRAAIQRLDAWARAGRGEYLAAGPTPRALRDLLPGVGVRVLGPPTVRNWPDLLRERRSDPEYWLRTHAAVRRGIISFEAEMEEIVELDRASRGIDVHLADPVAPGPVRWLLERMRRQQTFQVHRLVRILDDMLNNTSLILQFDFGVHRMLFAGDAEVANWAYLLRAHPQRGTLLRELRAVDLYKVGHHGSRNATPKLGLYGLWDGRPKGALRSLLSTKLNVYPGRTDATAVPHRGLLTGLRRLGPIESTHELAKSVSYVELVADRGTPGYRRRTQKLA